MVRDMREQLSQPVSHGCNHFYVSLVGAARSVPAVNSFSPHRHTYILDENHEPVREVDFEKWSVWMFSDNDRRQVKLTEQGDVWVSTVFLGLDHHFGNGPLLLFETMSFIAHEGVDQWRYSTWAEAEAGHDRIVALVFQPTPILVQG